MNENDGWFQMCEIECGKEFMYLVCTPATIPRQLDVTLHEIEFECGFRFFLEILYSSSRSTIDSSTFKIK